MRITRDGHQVDGEVVLSKALRFFAVVSKLDDVVVVNVMDFHSFRSVCEANVTHSTADNFQLTDGAKFIFFLKPNEQAQTLVKKNLANGEEQEIYTGAMQGYQISWEGNFVVIVDKYLFRFLLINVSTGEHFQYHGYSHVDFSRDEKYFYALQSRVFETIDLQTGAKEQNIFDHGLSSWAKFSVHENGRLLLIQDNSLVGIFINIYDLVTSKWYSRITPNYQSIRFAQFIGQERLLVVTEKKSPPMLQANRENEPAYELFIYDLGDRKAPQRLKVNSLEKMVVNSAGTEIAIVADNKLTTIHVPTRSELRYSWQVLNEQNQLVVLEGIDLIRIAHHVVRNFLPRITGVLEAQDNVYRIKNAKDWLRTAGHLSKYILSKKSFEKYGEAKWYPSSFAINSAQPVKINKGGNGDAIVAFPMCQERRGDYVSISNYLAGLTAHPLPTEEQIARVFETNWQELPPPNNKHIDVALALLTRMTGNSYPDGFTADQQHFLDSLLVLMLGVETSRNNTTFLTAVMLLDLIASRAAFGRMHRAYSWDNAFVSGPGYSWNDFEQKDCGGKFPMATNCTGTGNLAARRDAIVKDQGVDEIFIDSQRRRVEEREMSLLVNWLEGVKRKDPALFQQCKNEVELQKAVEKVFFDRLNRAYFSQEPCLSYLSANKSGVYAKPGQRHYKDVPYIFYITTGFCDGNKNNEKVAAHYHRTDHPCAEMPGFALKGKGKVIKVKEGGKEQDREVFSHVTVIKKRRLQIFRESMGFASTLQKIKDNDQLSPAIKEKISNILRVYNDWQLSYFDTEKLFDSFYNFFGFKRIHKDEIARYVFERVRWEKKAGCENRYKITAEQIKKILRSMEELQAQFGDDHQSFSRFLEDYADKFLWELQDIFDLHLENDGWGMPVSVDITQGSDLERHNKIVEIANQEQVSEFPPETYGLVVSFLNLILSDCGIPQFEMDFRVSGGGKKLSPCPSCYSESSEPYPALPYNHLKVVCLSHEQSKTYHRVDSDCQSIYYDYSKGKYFIKLDQDSVEAQASFVLAEQQKGKTPCEFCWWPFQLDQQAVDHNPKKRDRDKDFYEPVDAKRRKPNEPAAFSASVAAATTSSSAFLEGVHKTVSTPVQRLREDIARKALKNEEQLKVLLSKEIPAGLVLGKARDQGDCFFDALAQIVNGINSTDVNTDKYLRSLCHDFYLKNKELVDGWNASEFGGIDGQKDGYYMVQYTVDECEKDFNGRSPIWGRPNVEGRILCHQLNLEAICVIEILEDPATKQSVVSFHIANKDTYKSISDEEAQVWLKNPKIPTVVVDQNSLHFVPLLTSAQEANKPLVTQFGERSLFLPSPSAAQIQANYKENLARRIEKETRPEDFDMDEFMMNSSDEDQTQKPTHAM